MSGQPTEAQIKEFWEWCGLPYQGYGNANRLKAKNPPLVNLNNLERYAMPKFQIALFSYPFEAGGKKYFACAMNGAGYADSWNDNPALALFWALWKVKEESNVKPPSR